jgi:hypothetical protein
MVSKRLTRKIVMTRLMVGHTHEDIDGIFGLIWEKMKVRKCMTPRIFSKLLMDACRNKEKIIEVHDIWAVPDYTKYLIPFITPDLGCYAKGMFAM